jgi:hypothetical protein
VRALAALVLLVAQVAEARPLTGKVTRFGYAGDAHAGGVSRCLGRKVLPTDWGVATRTGKCGQLFRIRNHRTGRVVIAPRINAGPYGAMHDGAWVVKRRASDPGTWRGILDATPLVFLALEAKSFDRVTVEAVR